MSPGPTGPVLSVATGPADGAPEPAAAAAAAASPLATDASDGEIRRRITAIWLLLFINVLTPRPDAPSLFPISKPLGQLLTGCCLAVALILALGLNRRLVVRPNLVLGLATILAATAFITSIRGLAGMGSLLRCARLFGFLGVLWLLTPWWGRRDLLIARAHLKALLVVCGTVLVGLVVAPGKALSGAGAHRLIGVVWSIPAPQVAEYAALVAGMAVALWAAGGLRFRTAAAAAGLGLAMIAATQTRTALVAVAVATTAAVLVMFRARRRVRRAVTIVVVAVPLLFLAMAPVVMDWFDRDQSSTEIAGLTGRRQVWDALLAAPHAEFNHWFGFGLSDKSFGGLAIDSTWLAVYHDEGLFGVGVIGVTLAYLLVAAVRHPTGPERSLAVFLVVYVAVASYTEVGLGDASPYLLSVVAAASLVTPRGAAARRSA
ncbi:MAG: hypothetical protein QOI99_534 [Actinomycetota bacterium]|nr:hypothetical protein [Actinomycetota bacterium]